MKIIGKDVHEILPSKPFFDHLVVIIVTLLKSRSIHVVSLACFMDTSNVKEIGCDMHILMSADNAYPKHFGLNPQVVISLTRLGPN